MRRNTASLVRVCYLPMMVCACNDGCLALCDSPPLDLIWMFVRRRGEADWIIKYPAWEVDDAGRICFFIDNQFPKKPGRYDGLVMLGDDEVGLIEFDVLPEVTLADVVVSARRSRFPDAPEGIGPMYEPIQNFQACLQKILEKDGVELPISQADIDILAGFTPCKPAQLVIEDGVRTEIVEYEVRDGKVFLTRARGVGGPYRFPAGSVVRFAWTEQNVLNAIEGC